jgi:uncharacterized protein (DUF849 family)/DNA-binding IclR family transcriptional regulator
MSAVITVATTGPIAFKSDNPALPTTPEEIASEVALAYAAGAAVAHIHVRDSDQRPTADLSVARRVMSLIAERCPILIQLSTGVGLGVPFEDRERLVELRPRMATLNPCSMTFGRGEFLNPPDGVRRLAARMRELGVKPELEIYDTGHLDVCLRLFDEGLLDEPLQFSLVLGVLGGMAATADNLLTMVRRLPPGAIWQVIAIGRASLPLTAMGLALGGNARAGMEDTLYLRKGELTPGNLPLVSRAVALCRDLDRPVASVAETAALLKLPSALSFLMGIRVPGAGGIQVITRTAEILRVLRTAPSGLTQAEIGEHIGLARSTVHRLLNALADEGLVQSTGPRGKYRLGPEISRMAEAAWRGSLSDLHPLLEELSRAVQETVDLSVLERLRVTFVDQVVASQRLRAVSAVGESFPLHACANGKAFLAAMPDRVLESLPLQVLTPNTITEPAKLSAELDAIREAGYAVDREEHTLGICAIGAVLGPIAGTPVAVSIPMPTQRFHGREQELSAALLTWLAAHHPHREKF